MGPPDWTCHPSGDGLWRFGKEVLPDSEPYRKSQGSLVTGGEVRRSNGDVQDGGTQGRPNKDLRILLTGKHDSHAHEAEGLGDRRTGLRQASFFFCASEASHRPIVSSAPPVFLFGNDGRGRSAPRRDPLVDRRRGVGTGSDK